MSVHKYYAEYDLESRGAPNITHNTIWRAEGAETLRTIRFGEPRAPNYYAQYDLNSCERRSAPRSFRKLRVLKLERPGRPAGQPDGGLAV